MEIDSSNHLTRSIDEDRSYWLWKIKERPHRHIYLIYIFIYYFYAVILHHLIITGWSGLYFESRMLEYNFMVAPRVSVLDTEAYIIGYSHLSIYNSNFIHGMKQRINLRNIEVLTRTTLYIIQRIICNICSVFYTYYTLWLRNLCCQTAWTYKFAENFYWEPQSIYRYSNSI